MKRLRAAVAITALVLASGTPSHAEDMKFYFDCPGDGVRVNNADLLVATRGAGWSDSAPGSVADGNGCTALDTGSNSGTNQANVYDAVFTGEAETDPETGLASMTVELHGTPLLAQTVTLETQRLRLRGCLNGESFGGTEPSAPGLAFDIVPTSVNDGLSYRFEFTITDLVSTGGFHEVRINVHAGHTNAAWLWTWGASEVPGGITFNPATPADVTVAAAAPTTGCGAN